MGGSGSGYFSWRRLPRNIVERAFVLDIAAFRRIREAAGTLATGQLTLVARATGETLHLHFGADLTMRQTRTCAVCLPAALPGLELPGAQV